MNHFVVLSMVTLLSSSTFARTNIKAHRVGRHILYVGTYNVRGSRGIYAYTLDPGSGSLHRLGLMAEAVNPSFLAVHSGKATLYAVSEAADYKGQNSGSIQAYKIDPTTGKLTLLNEVSSQGAGPCFLLVDEKSNYLFTANYQGGSLAVFPILEDGRVGRATAVVQHQGSGATPTRQNKPHPHSLELTPDGKLLVAADLGLDKLLLYRFDASDGSLSPAYPPSVKVHDAAGPRHTVFGPDGRHLYVINEIDSTVTVFAVTQKNGPPQQLQTLSTLPSGYVGPSDASEIRLSDDGKFLYVSNRGHDSITVFAVDGPHGTLRVIGNHSSGGKTPITFQISPDGKFLLVANQRSDKISVLRNDPPAFTLAPTAISEDVAAPSCIVFLPVTN